MVLAARAEVDILLTRAEVVTTVATSAVETDTSAVAADIALEPDTSAVEPGMVGTALPTAETVQHATAERTELRGVGTMAGLMGGMETAAAGLRGVATAMRLRDAGAAMGLRDAGAAMRDAEAVKGTP